jgi:bifunctional UDP-N-acetylglucosamine pyrophosphorylase/glucosamine-1-phosphate N-acetyltransferase
MEAIILAAGNGIRFRPLSLTRPKPLFPLLGKTILEHNLEQLNGLVPEVILVVGYKGQMIRDLIGERYKNLKIRYVWQKKQLGTGDAAKCALPFIKDKFLLLNGDDLYSRKDIKEALSSFPSLLAKEVDEPKSFGLVIKKRKFVESIIEKPKKPISNLVNTGLYFLDKKIFGYQISKSRRGEYEFTDYIKKLIKEKKLYLKIAKDWLALSLPENLLKANQMLLDKEKPLNQGKIERDCQIFGKVIIGKGSIIKRGSFIEGPVWIGRNSIIGQNSYLKKYTSIGNNCLIEDFVKINNSIIGKKTKISQFSFISDSIIDKRCSLGKGAILCSEKGKFGAILAKEVRIGAGALICPEVKIWPRKKVPLGRVVKKDIK